MELIARHSRTQRMTCHVTGDAVVGTGKAMESSSQVVKTLDNLLIIMVSVGCDASIAVVVL